TISPSATTTQFLSASTTCQTRQTMLTPPGPNAFTSLTSPAASLIAAAWVLSTTIRKKCATGSPHLTAKSNILKQRPPTNLRKQYQKKSRKPQTKAKKTGAPLLIRCPF